MRDAGSDLLVVARAHGDGNSLLGDNIGNLGSHARLAGRVDGLANSSRGKSDAGEATGLVLLDDRRRNGSSLGDRADGLGQNDGVSDDHGGLGRLGKRSNAGSMSRAVGNGGSTAGDGVDHGRLDGQSREAIAASAGGTVAPREVQVTSRVVGRGHGGHHAESCNNRLHFCVGYELYRNTRDLDVDS